MTKDSMKPGAATDPKHNQVAREECVQKGFKKRFELEQKKEKAMAAYIQPIAEELTRLKRNLKKDVDIDGKDLTLMYAIYARQEYAKTLEEEDRYRIMGNLKDAFAANLGQLDFIDAMDHAPNLSEKDKLKDAYGAGYGAGSDGFDRSTNPHDEDTPESDQFYLGFDKAQEEIALAMTAPDDDSADQSAAQ